VTETPDESDQLPEEAPPEVTPRDDPPAADEDTVHNPGVPGEEETSTGNPDAAGVED
jgi:hypothetical protein